MRKSKMIMTKVHPTTESVVAVPIPFAPFVQRNPQVQETIGMIAEKTIPLVNAQTKSLSPMKYLIAFKHSNKLILYLKTITRKELKIVEKIEITVKQIPEIRKAIKCGITKY